MMDHAAAVARLQGQNRERRAEHAKTPDSFISAHASDIAMATALFMRAAGLSATDPAQAEAIRDRAEAIYERLELEYQIVGQNR